MKKFKFLLAGFVVVFFFSTSVNAQKEKVSERFSWGTEAEPFCFWCPCAGELDEEGYPMGEYLCGIVTVHKVLNKKMEHWNMKGGKLIGSETGRIYTFVRTDNIKLTTGEIVINVRTIGENGLTTYWQVRGSWENQTFYCR